MDIEIDLSLDNEALKAKSEDYACKSWELRFNDLQSSQAEILEYEDAMRACLYIVALREMGFTVSK